MANAAVIIETTGNEVKAANFGVLTAARAEGTNEVFAFVFGGDANAYKTELEKYGVKRIVSIESDGADLEAKPDLKAKALIAAMKEFGVSALLTLSSSTGKDIMARVAAEMRAPLALDCVAVDMAAQTVQKPYFSGKTIATLKLKGDNFLCAIRPNSIDATQAPEVAEVATFTAPVGEYDGLVIKEVKKNDS